MDISQSEVGYRLSILMEDMAADLGKEVGCVEFEKECTEEGEIYQISRYNRHVKVCVGHGITMSTWFTQWGRKMEEATYQLDIPTMDDEVEYIVWVIDTVFRYLLQHSSRNLFRAIFCEIFRKSDS